MFICNIYLFQLFNALNIIYRDTFVYLWKMKFGNNKHGEKIIIKMFNFQLSNVSLKTLLILKKTKNIKLFLFIIHMNSTKIVEYLKNWFLIWWVQDYQNQSHFLILYWWTLQKSKRFILYLTKVIFQLFNILLQKGQYWNKRLGRKHSFSCYMFKRSSSNFSRF